MKQFIALSLISKFYLLNSLHYHNLIFLSISWRLYTFGLESLLQLFRRFLFNDTSSATLTLAFVFISGIEEIAARSFMEKKEIWLRKLLGSKPLTEIEMVAKRQYFSHSVTSRSILEIASIIIAPTMLVCFSENRFAVDLGYNGLEDVDVKTLFVTTLIQIVVELLTIYLCSLMEIRQNVPMSDYFFQFRNSSVFFCHLFYFAAASHW